MYEVHLEWQTRVCPVGVTSLARQFRRYFDRFEGRIREPPYAVYDDLAYTQGDPPTKNPSPPPSVSNGGMLAGPNLEEYRERLRGFAMDLGREGDDVMQGILTPNPPSNDLSDLYNFSFSRPDETIFLDPFTQTSSATFPQTTLSPFDIGSIPTTSLPGGATTTQEIPDFLFDEDQLAFGGFDDLFGDMPDMPGLDGAIDQGFLEFLDTTQQQS